jgi:hypothetical protein
MEITKTRKYETESVDHRNQQSILSFSYYSSANFFAQREDFLSAFPALSAFQKFDSVIQGTSCSFETQRTQRLRTPAYGVRGSLNALGSDSIHAVKLGASSHIVLHCAFAATKKTQGRNDPRIRD